MRIGVFVVKVCVDCRKIKKGNIYTGCLLKIETGFQFAPIGDAQAMLIEKVLKKWLDLRLRW